MVDLYCEYEDCRAPMFVRDEDIPQQQGAYAYDCPVCRRGFRRREQVSATVIKHAVVTVVIGSGFRHDGIGVIRGRVTSPGAVDGC